MARHAWLVQLVHGVALLLELPQRRGEGAVEGEVAGRHADPSLHKTPCAPLRSVMLVGLGGNNGTTLLAGVLANKQ